MPECINIWGDPIVPALKMISPFVLATYFLLCRLKSTPLDLLYLSNKIFITCASNMTSKFCRPRAGLRKALEVESRLPSFIVACWWVKLKLVSALISPIWYPRLWAASKKASDKGVLYLISETVNNPPVEWKRVFSAYLLFWLSNNVLRAFDTKWF